MDQRLTFDFPHARDCRAKIEAANPLIIDFEKMVQGDILQLIDKAIAARETVVQYMETFGINPAAVVAFKNGATNNTSYSLKEVLANQVHQLADALKKAGYRIDKCTGTLNALGNNDDGTGRSFKVEVAFDFGQGKPR